MKKLVAAAIAVSLTAIVPATAQVAFTDLIAKARETWDAPTEPFRIIGNVYYVGSAGLASYLVAGPEGHILIDTVMPGKTALITTNIEKLGFKLADIKVMVNTHAHLDHTGNFGELKAMTSAQMAAGTKDVPLLEKGVYPGRESVEALKFPPVKVDRPIADGDVITVGPTKLVAHATPGHSPGCTTWTLDVTEAGQQHGVIFFCSATVALNQLIGANATHPGIVDDYKRTLATAGDIKGDVFLAPHPEMYDLGQKRTLLATANAGGQNPFVKPGEFQTYLIKLKAEFDAGLAKQATQN